jgi:hypothetical protein
LALRDSKEARAFRQQMVFLDEATSVGDDKLVLTIALELTNKLGDLEKRVSQPTLEIQVSYPLAI